jgi:hypothetical protein
MDIMFYVSGILKTLGIFAFVIGYPVLGIISFIILHLQNNRKAVRWGSNLLFLILPYIIFETLLMLSIEMSLNEYMRLVVSGLLLCLTPLPHLLIVKMAKQDNSRKLLWAGWLAFSSAACAGGGVFFTFLGICI